VDFPAIIEYTEPYLPSPRHRKPRFQKAEVRTNLTLHELTDEHAPVACTVHSGLPFQQDGAALPLRYEAATDRWWRPTHQECEAVPEQVVRRAAKVSGHEVHTPESAVRAAQAVLQGYAFTPDGQVWVPANEPVYVLRHYGLGYNHGGVGLVITTAPDHEEDTLTIGATEREMPGDPGHTAGEEVQGWALALKRLHRACLEYGATPEQAQENVERRDERIEVLIPQAFKHHGVRDLRLRVTARVEVEIVVQGTRSAGYARGEIQGHLGRLLTEKALRSATDAAEILDVQDLTATGEAA